MANEQNLKPFPKGVSGNPAGRPRGVENSRTRLLRILELTQKKRNPVTGEDEEFSIAEQMDLQLINKALKGDLKAYEILFDRLEGKPKQTTDINANIQGSVEIIVEPDANCQPIKD